VGLLESNRKYDKFALAMNSQIQSNKYRPVIEKPKTYPENQVNEDIRPIIPFNFEEELKDSIKMERRGL